MIHYIKELLFNVWVIKPNVRLVKLLLNQFSTPIAQIENNPSINQWQVINPMQYIEQEKKANSSNTSINVIMQWNPCRLD